MAVAVVFGNKPIFPDDYVSLREGPDESSLLILQAACKLGFPVLYGDGSRSVVLHTAGITQPKAVMVMYTGRQKSVQSSFSQSKRSPCPVSTQSLAYLFETDLDITVVCCSCSYSLVIS